MRAFDQKKYLLTNTKAIPLSSQRAYRLFLINLFLFSFILLTAIYSNPSYAATVTPLSTSVTGGANLISKIAPSSASSSALLGQGASSATTNGVKLITEYHYVNNASASSYQANCHGGAFIQVPANSGSLLFYSCLVPIYPWYINAGNPANAAIYNAAYSLYYQETQGTVQWTNPLSNVVETVSTTAIPTTTYAVSTCIPLYGSLLQKPAGYGYYIIDYTFPGYAASLYFSMNLGPAFEVDTPNVTASTYDCSHVSTVTVLVIAGQTLSPSLNWSNIYGYYNPQNSTNTAGVPPYLGSYASTPAPTSYGINYGAYTNLYGVANYTVAASDVGQTVFLAPCVTAVDSYGWTSSSKLPAAGTNMVSFLASYCSWESANIHYNQTHPNASPP